MSGLFQQFHDAPQPEGQPERSGRPRWNRTRDVHRYTVFFIKIRSMPWLAAEVFVSIICGVEGMNQRNHSMELSSLFNSRYLFDDILVDECGNRCRVTAEAWRYHGDIRIHSLFRVGAKIWPGMMDVIMSTMQVVANQRACMFNPVMTFLACSMHTVTICFPLSHTP